MATAFIGIGSNIERESNIRSGLKSLHANFSHVRISTVYESSAVGFSGDNFFNLVALVETELDAHALQDKLHEIEAQFGRVRGAQRYVSRTLDLDLLLYDDLVIDEKGLQLPREDVTEFAFVLRPLSEMAGELLHPVLKTSYADLWKEFDQSDQVLWPVDFDV